jgi:hypothetical protein
MPVITNQTLVVACILPHWRGDSVVYQLLCGSAKPRY